MSVIFHRWSRYNKMFVAVKFFLSKFLFLTYICRIFTFLVELIIFVYWIYLWTLNITYLMHHLCEYSRYLTSLSRVQQQLQSLMETLSSTEPHYVRCVKPNSLNRPNRFERSSILHQLRCGVSVVIILS